MVRCDEPVARPKALYKPVFIETKSDDQVFANGVSFKSRVLKVNLENTYRVFPFVATCGTELSQWAQALHDTLDRFFAETIKNLALITAIKHLDADIRERFHTGNISQMTPGSLKDWPIEEQRPLFTILGDIEKAIGVQLMDSLMMNPTQSVSGIIFPTEVNFESCQLCPRKKCPGRRAPSRGRVT